MKCLILGGGGFIGLHLAEALVAEGHTIRLFDRPGLTLPRTLQHGPIERAEGDFINHEDVARALNGCEIVFHLVSTTLPENSNLNPLYDVETNILGSLRLLELARTKSVRKIIFISSGGTVYGVPEQLPIPETHPTQPITAYGIGKLMIEKYLGLYHALHGMEYSVLRLANPYGERQRVNTPQGAIAVFLHRALHDEMIEIWGDGTVIRDFIYISDAVAAIVMAMHYRGETRIFNIGSGIGLSLNDVFVEIERALERPVKRRYMPGRKFDVPINVLDITRIQRVLGWQPTVSFATGLRSTLAWLQRASNQ
jgi:UDP-glucose 4-epimerase